MANNKLHSWIRKIRMEWGFDSLAAISRTAAFGTIVALGSMLSSCNDLMHDDLPSCDMGVDLQFKYDYNVQRADMFNDHVGGVCVFVFDEQGNLVARQDAANEGKSQPLKDPNYAMRIDLQPGKYHFATFAFQKKYEEALSQAGAKFHIEAPAAGESIEKLRTRLDRNAGKVENQALPLDTLWQGLGNETVEVKDLQITRHTISLVRDTKQLTISLHQLDEPADIHAEDFSYQITDANGYINYDNSLLPDRGVDIHPIQDLDHRVHHSGGYRTGAYRSRRPDVLPPRVASSNRERKECDTEHLEQEDGRRSGPHQSSRFSGTGPWSIRSNELFGTGVPGQRIRLQAGLFPERRQVAIR